MIDDLDISGVLTFAIAGLIVIVLLGVFFDSSQAVSTSGVITYGYFGLSQDSIQWGTLSPGENKTVVLEIFDLKHPDLKLSCETSNFNPPGAIEYLNLQYINNSTALELTLCVSLDIQDITTFSFDITVREA